MQAPRTLALAIAALALVACGGADTAADKVDTTGVTAVGSGTGAGDSARAATGGSGSLMGDSVTRDSILGDSAGHDTINRRPPTRTRP
jgi:hypothetical protein